MKVAPALPSLLALTLSGLVLFLGQSVQAFSPNYVVPGTIVRSSQRFSVLKKLRMSTNEEAEKLREKARQLKEEAAALSGTTVEAMEAAKTEAKAPAKQGDLYDDEVAPYVDPLSDNMRARLMKEASTGLDSESKQTNVILYISVAVAILVALGGQGILY